MHNQHRYMQMLFLLALNFILFIEVLEAYKSTFNDKSNMILFSQTLTFLNTLMIQMVSKNN